ncbi:hypothetical protein EW093_14415 [Thiospirochaeta perfilievii]|uniref:Uncharacterized protein n=1 Tax=Thiospirochaeta perfilievii TaxID=252967 RepID=A0A5C1QCL7_9SPIO|nr:hypothetical protein [Thiospirochaeta perfilievii]QEN05843.1 hypothetical protein EW093_14415 [Thiospirochaeta perfilievii]
MDEYYELIGGYLEFDKKAFLLDIVSPKSEIRRLITSGDRGFKPPKIVKKESSVKVLFDDSTDIDLDKNYKEYFTRLKEKYKKKMQGRLIVRVSCYATFFSNVDFNRDEKAFFY